MLLQGLDSTSLIATKRESSQFVPMLWRLEKQIIGDVILAMESGLYAASRSLGNGYMPAALQFEQLKIPSRKNVYHESL